MSVRQQSIPAAFEIRFTDASVEVHEIGNDSIPEPFKKRDKIPRNSGSFVSPERLSGADAQSQPTTQKWTKHHLGENPINAPQRNPGQKGRQSVINKKFSENKSVDENAVVTDIQKEKLTHISTPKRVSRSKRTHSSSESLSDHQVVPNNKAPKHRNNTSTKYILKTQPLSSPRRYSSDSNLRPSSGLSTPPTTPPPTPPNKATVPDNRTFSDNSAPSTPPSFSTTKKPQLNLSSSPPIITPFSADLSDSPVEEYPPPATTPTIPHDEVIIPTVAKKLRKTRQFSESGYTDITDQVENLFGSPSSPLPNSRRQGSTPTTRRRPNSKYRSRYGRQSMYEVSVNITDIHQVPRNSYNNRGRDQEYEKAEDNYETPASTKFPGTDLSNGNEGINADMGSRTNAYPFSQQGNPKIVIHPDNVNQHSYTLELEKTFTQATTEDKKGKKNKKKNKKQGKNGGVTDENEDELVKQSKCCCIIC